MIECEIFFTYNITMNTADKKASFLIFLKILEEYSDEEHPLSQKDIIDKFAKYGLEINRRTITNYLNFLRDETDLGYYVSEPNKSKKGYYLETSSRLFDPSEIKYIIDALYSSKFLSSKHAKDIIDSLLSTLSKYQRANYTSSLYKSKISSSHKENDMLFFSNIDCINEAINKKKKITFKYKDIDVNGQKIYRNDGYRYSLSPYFLINNFGKYYVLGKSYNRDNLSPYRVDKIDDIELTDIGYENIESVKNLSSFTIEKYLKEHIYTFGSKTSLCKIKFDEKYSIAYDVIDWFGDVTFTHDENGHYASFICDELAFYYWCLQYGENITVIEPFSIIKRIYNFHTKEIEKYKNIISNEMPSLDIEMILNTYLNEEIYKKIDLINNTNHINENFINFLKDQLTTNYEVKCESKEIHILNRNKLEESYVISFVASLNSDHSDLFQNALAAIKKTEKRKNSYVIIISDKEKHFKKIKDKENCKNKAEEIFNYSRSIEKGKTLYIKNEKVTFDNSYKIQWLAIPHTKKKTKYTILKSK